MPSRVTSDPSPAPRASPGHGHGAGPDGDGRGLLAETPRRAPPPPRPAAPLSRTVPQPRGARPGGEPLCRAERGGSLHPEPRNFISAPRPSRRALPFALRGRGKRGVCVTRRWRRGTRRPRRRTLGPAHASRGDAGKAPPPPAPGPPGSPEGGGCSQPRSAGAPLAESRSERLGRGGRVPPARAAAPSHLQPQRGSGEGRGGAAGTPRRSPGARPGRDPTSSADGASSPSCSASGTARMRKACEVEPEF